MGHFKQTAILNNFFAIHHMLTYFSVWNEMHLDC